MCPFEWVSGEARAKSRRHASSEIACEGCEIEILASAPHALYTLVAGGCTCFSPAPIRVVAAACAAAPSNFE